LLCWDAVEHSTGCENVVCGAAGKIVFGNEAEIKESSRDGGLHDYYRGTVVSAGGGENGEMGAVSGSNDEAGAI
jgi:hypothetical protein